MLNLCEECFTKPSTTHCLECDQKLCQACTDLIHRGGKRKTHKRKDLCHSCQCLSTHSCLTCQSTLCESCVYIHSHSSIQKLSNLNSVAIFWDLSSSSSKQDKDIQETLSKLFQQYSNIHIIKLYGEEFFKYKQLFFGMPCEFSNYAGIKESEAMLLDISLISKDMLNDVLVISNKAQALKVHLTQIQSRLLGVSIWVSITFPDLNPLPIKDLQKESKNLLTVPKVGIFRPSSGEQQKNPEILQVYQNFPRQKGQNYSHDLLINYLKELADAGQIMNDAGWLCKEFAKRVRVSMSESNTVIKEVERMGQIHTIERSFCDLKMMFFTCLKISSLSYESIIWTLRSLKQDEMLPTERAIQSRIKEVFDYKIPATDWESFIDSCKQKHFHTKSAPEYSSYSLFSSNSQSSNPSFTMKEIPDAVTKQLIILIYPKGEEWDSKDQYIKEGDVLGVKDTPDWEAFVEFLSDYFSLCKPGDDSRAIPGGRYGCAQFLKLCGNSTLKACSLGKLSYMVQLSIDEYLLRYYRTLLIWVPNSQKLQGDKENNQKLAIVQKKIIEVLKENKEGLSLAQLPLYIKRKVNFNINISELGFAKLKDLLLIMPDVEIELRGTNHPFAVYKMKTFKDKEEELKKIIEQALNECGCWSLHKIEGLVRAKGFLGFSEFKCENFIEFVMKKCEFAKVVEDRNAVKICRVDEVVGASYELTQAKFQGVRVLGVDDCGNYFGNPPRIN